MDNVQRKASAEKLNELSRAFMAVSGFYGSGQEDTLGEKVMNDMNVGEKAEYNWDLPRGHANWAEFFSKVAIRQGRMNDIVPLVPVAMMDNNTIQDLAYFNMPQFALIVSLAQRKP